MLSVLLPDIAFIEEALRMALQYTNNISMLAGVCRRG